MTEQQKAQVISKYLDPMDCSSYNPTSYFGMECEESFMQYEESDDGCYMTIGGYVFRCHAKGKDAMTAYVNAIQLYLTLV
jgi:hypothetical protein